MTVEACVESGGLVVVVALAAVAAGLTKVAPVTWRCCWGVRKGEGTDGCAIVVAEYGRREVDCWWSVEWSAAGDDDGDLSTPSTSGSTMDGRRCAGSMSNLEGEGEDGGR